MPNKRVGGLLWGPGKLQSINPAIHMREIFLRGKKMKLIEEARLDISRSPQLCVSNIQESGRSRFSSTIQLFVVWVYAPHQFLLTPE